jgi:hypothetical protein
LADLLYPLKEVPDIRPPKLCHYSEQEMSSCYCTWPRVSDLSSFKKPAKRQSLGDRRFVAAQTKSGSQSMIPKGQS